MSASGARPLAWTIVVLNRGWSARTLLPEARRLADLGERSIMLVYVVGTRRHPRRAWLWHGRRIIRRALGARDPALASSLMRSETVIGGVGQAAAATGGAVMIRLGDLHHDAELRTRGITRLALDVIRPRPASAPGPQAGPAHTRRDGVWRGRS